MDVNVFKSYLNEKLLSPVVKVVEWFHHIHIIYKNTTVSSTVKSNTETLEPFLPCCIPYLKVLTPSISQRNAPVYELLPCQTFNVMTFTELSMLPTCGACKVHLTRYKHSREDTAIRELKVGELPPNPAYSNYHSKDFILRALPTPPTVT